jgi:glycosyltransferase involved in cell wall biosynthesis
LARILTTVTAGTNLIEQAVLDVDDLAGRLEKLYRDPALIREYSEAGRRFAESLHWDQLLPQWLQAISAAAGVDVGT